MKKFYQLLNHEFAKLRRALALLAVGMVLSPLLLLRAEMASRQYSPYTVHDRFEDLYMSSGAAYASGLLFAFWCAFFVKMLYADYWGSKGIYTYLTLPVRREAVYGSKLGAFFTGTLAIWAAHLVSVWLGYSYVAGRISSYAGEFVMENGLFLAAIRSAFFRLTMPLSGVELVSTASLLLALITGIYYVAVCERSKRYLWLVLPAGAWLLLVQVTASRLAEPAYMANEVSLYTRSAILVIMSVVFVLHSIRLIKKGAIA